MSIDSVGIHIGPLNIRFYGLLILTGIILATNAAVWMAKRDGKDPNHIWDGLIWALIPGLIGARLWFVFFPSSSLAQQGVDLQWHLEHFFELYQA